MSEPAAGSSSTSGAGGGAGADAHVEPSSAAADAVAADAPGNKTTIAATDSAAAEDEATAAYMDTIVQYIVMRKV